MILDKRNVLRYGAGSRLDHGVLVPLYYLKKHGFSKPVVVVNIGFLRYSDLYRFGRIITQSASELGKKVGVLASGDLSHRLQPGAPAGYNPMGRIFDETLMEYLDRFSVEDILTMPSDLIQDAGECGLRPICIMLGTLDAVSYTHLVRNVSEARWIRRDVEGEKDVLWEFWVTADGFLYRMIRLMVGTLIDVGRGYLPQGTVREALDTDRKNKDVKIGRRCV